MKQFGPIATLLLFAACSGGGNGEDVPPLPEQTAVTANILMDQAERAAADAAAQAETAPVANRSQDQTTNEVIR